MATVDPLAGFSPVVREWFGTTFAEATPPQAGGWPAIGRGEHVLITAPTGSGKTLAAFLAGLDRLVTDEVPEKDRRCRILYLSPLRALAVEWRDSRYESDRERSGNFYDGLRSQ